MTDYYSEHYAAASTATTAPGTAALDPRTLAQSGRSGVALCTHTCHFDTTMIATSISAADQFRFCTMKSGDRIQAMRLSNLPAWAGTTLTMDLGLYAPGLQHDGAVLDLNLFATLLDLVGNQTRADVMLESGSLVEEDRGKALWELYAKTDGSDTTDPVVDYDIVGTIAAVTAFATGGPLLLEVDYHPAGIN